MVVMSLELDNLLVFDNFSINMSYPKRILGSTIPSEHLFDRPHFRYKKLVVIMGANATGKTALGKILVRILNFISRREYSLITELIENKKKDASFSIDLAFSTNVLVRVKAKIRAKDDENSDYTSDDISVEVKTVRIAKTDTYEKCIKKIDSTEPVALDSYVKALETIPPLTWVFEFPFASEGKQRAVAPPDPDKYCRILEKTLKALDPRIKNVEKIRKDENSYLITYPTRTVLIKDGEIVNPAQLSSGTTEGVGVANLVSVMKMNRSDFFFCDEKFSHIHSVSEKAFLSVLIEMLSQNQQLIFTSHNSDILDMDLPKHSFAFLRRDEMNKISCVYASAYLKKNTESLKKAVENDLFSASPDVTGIFDLVELE